MEIFLRSSWKPLKSPVLVKLPMPFIKWVGNTEETCKRERLGASSIGHGSTGIWRSCPIGELNRTREHRDLAFMSDRLSQSDTGAAVSGIHCREASAIGQGSAGIWRSYPIGGFNRAREHRNLAFMSDRRAQSDTGASESGVHVR